MAFSRKSAKPQASEASDSQVTTRSPFQKYFRKGVKVAKVTAVAIGISYIVSVRHLPQTVYTPSKKKSGYSADMIDYYAGKGNVPWYERKKDFEKLVAEAYKDVTGNDMPSGIHFVLVGKKNPFLREFEGCDYPIKIPEIPYGVSIVFLNKDVSLASALKTAGHEIGHTLKNHGTFEKLYMRELEADAFENMFSNNANSKALYIQFSKNDSAHMYSELMNLFFRERMDDGQLMSFLDNGRFNTHEQLVKALPWKLNADERAYLDALGNVANGEYGKAIAILERLASMKENRSELKDALMLLKRGKKAEALKLFDESVGIADLKQDAQIALAVVLAGTEDKKRAYAAYQPLLDMDPNCRMFCRPVYAARSEGVSKKGDKAKVDFFVHEIRTAPTREYLRIVVDDAEAQLKLNGNRKLREPIFLAMIDNEVTRKNGQDLLVGLMRTLDRNEIEFIVDKIGEKWFSALKVKADLVQTPHGMALNGIKSIEGTTYYTHDFALFLEGMSQVFAGSYYAGIFENRLPRFDEKERIEILKAMALASEESSQWAMAADTLERILKITPNDPWANMELARYRGPSLQIPLLEHALMGLREQERENKKMFREEVKHGGAKMTSQEKAMESFHRKWQRKK